MPSISATLATLALLAGPIAAYKLPYGVTDGTYVAYFNETGHEVHQLIDTAPVAAAKHSRDFTTSLSARQHGVGGEGADDHAVWITHCGCGRPQLNHGDCDAAVADLKGQLGRNTLIDGGKAYYSIRGGVVAFACDPVKNWQAAASSDLMAAAADHITKACGWYIPGTAEFDHDFAAEAAYLGYMAYSAGLDFCGNAIASGQSKC